MVRTVTIAVMIAALAAMTLAPILAAAQSVAEQTGSTVGQGSHAADSKASADLRLPCTLTLHKDRFGATGLARACFPL
jgi:hypothetical protein